MSHSGSSPSPPPSISAASEDNERLEAPSKGDDESGSESDPLGDLAYCLEARPSFSHGTLELPPESFTLFYGKGDDVRRIDLSNASNEQLKHLHDFCDAATFGRNQEDVLDESYRKARKLDRTDFACHFDPQRSGIVDVASREILIGSDSKRATWGELYKLNVYGPGSFFKPHQDTPRGQLMFGSLVVVFPTQYEGGELVLLPRDRDEATVLDFAQELKAAKQHSIAYAAFYSDVSHEVYEVKSGYRVTLTYNLYFGYPFISDVPSTATPDIFESRIEKSLSEVLDDPRYLPEGGLLGFGLRYQYPVKNYSYSVSQEGLESSLKGSDSAIFRLLSQKGLTPFLTAVYRDECNNAVIMSDKLPSSLDDLDIEADFYRVIQEELRGTVIQCSDEQKVEEWVTWVTKPVTSLNYYQHTVAAYGNEPTLEDIYADLALMVRIGEPGARTEA